MTFQITVELIDAAIGRPIIRAFWVRYGGDRSPAFRVNIMDVPWLAALPFGDAGAPFAGVHLGD